MLDAKKLVAVILRLAAGANILYLVGGFIMSAFMGGSFSGISVRFFIPIAIWLFLACFAYLYAIPLARFIAGDIDDQN